MFKTQFKLSFLKPFTGGTKCLVLLGFYSFYFIEFLHKAAYTSRVGKKFQIYGVQITRKYIPKSKKLKVDIFTYAFP